MTKLTLATGTKLIITAGVSVAADGVAPFVELPQTNLVLELDADRGPFVMNGPDVATWNDRSPAGNHLSQALVVRQPLLTTSGGYAAVEFDGTEALFQAASIITGSTDRTIFIVADYTGARVLGLLFGIGKSVTGGVYDLRRNNTNEHALLVVGGNRRWPNSDWTKSLWTTKLEGTDVTDVTSRVNGVDDTPIATGPEPINTTADATVLGTGINTSGAPNYAADSWIGHIHAVAAYDTALAPSEIIAVETILNGRWGIWI